jgi:hypothetical protein
MKSLLVLVVRPYVKRGEDVVIKKIKKLKVIISYSILVGLSVQSFSLFAGGRAAPKPNPGLKSVMEVQKEKKEEVKHNTATPVMQEFQQCVLKTDADGKNTIMIDCPDLEIFVASIVKDAVTGGKEANLSGNLLLFCEKVLSEKKEFSPEELSLVMPELLLLLSEKIEQTRAPRLDAPGSADGSIVGPLLDCNLQEVIDLLNQILALINGITAIVIIDINGTFSILADIKNTLTQDFNGTFTQLTDIFNTVTTCCNGTFTALADIKNTVTISFNGTFTALNEIVVDFNGTFTELTEIFNTLTTCCNGTFTALEDLEVTVTVDFSGTYTSLTELFNTVTTCCNGTFTALASIGSSPCNATPITGPTVITVPGFYCLANDIIGTITVEASNVNLSLNNHTVSAPGSTAIVINGVSNVFVTDGILDTTNIGIQLLNQTSDIFLRQILITNCSTGIELGVSCITTVIESIVIDTVSNIGINLLGQNNNAQCLGVKIVHLSGPQGIFSNFSSQTNNCLIENCQIIDSLINSTPSIINFFSISGSNNQFIDCSIQNVQVNSDSLAVGFNVSNNTLMRNCIIQNFTTISNLDGFIINDGSNVVLQNCVVIDLEAVGGIMGFQINSAIANCVDCLVQQCLSGLGAATGFFINSGECSLINCQAYNVQGTGFFLEENNGTLLNCESSYNSVDGFTFGTGSGNTVVGNCVAVQNGGIGFNGAVPAYSCFASNNVGGNYSGIPNQSATVSTLSRGNTFLP